MYLARARTVTGQMIAVDSGQASRVAHAGCAAGVGAFRDINPRWAAV